MAEVTIKAAYASVVEDDGMLFVGFAQGEDADEPYVLFRQPVTGGPIWFEVSDETFGAPDAVGSIAFEKDRIVIGIAAAHMATMGFVDRVTVEVGPDCDSAEEAIAALRAMYPV